MSRTRLVVSLVMAVAAREPLTAPDNGLQAGLEVESMPPLSPGMLSHALPAPDARLSSATLWDPDAEELCLPGEARLPEGAAARE